jgi:ArsR family transcriptional regulator
MTEAAPPDAQNDPPLPDDTAPRVAGVPAAPGPDDGLDDMVQSASAAATFLKAISHEGRLMILCHLATGEKTVTELEALLSARQAAVSQQLSRLRAEGLVTPRREGKAIHYRLTDRRAIRILDTVHELFCRGG